MEVPLLNFDDFEHGTQAEKNDFCARLHSALSHFGFVKITNHAVPDDVIDNTFSWSKRFFHLPLQSKLKAAHPPQPNPHRGWSCVGQEKLSVIAQGKAVFDLKESFDQGPKTDELYPNIWNEEADLPGFRSFMEEFYEHCHDLHMRLLSAIALSMSLPPSFFVQMCDSNSSELRLNHYPAVKCGDLAAGNMRISSHTDFGTITLLFQDSVGGLEVEKLHQAGSYTPIATGSKSEMIVNVGDCLQRWTNDRLRSANHRVTLPAELKDSLDGSTVADRYSIAYFGKPNRDVSVCTIAALMRPDEEVRYTEDVTAWQYNQSRLLQTY